MCYFFGIFHSAINDSVNLGNILRHPLSCPVYHSFSALLINPAGHSTSEAGLMETVWGSAGFIDVHNAENVT
jgi:hypothetical protein